MSRLVFCGSWYNYSIPLFLFVRQFHVGVLLHYSKHVVSRVDSLVMDRGVVDIYGCGEKEISGLGPFLVQWRIRWGYGQFPPLVFAVVVGDHVGDAVVVGVLA